MKQIGIKSEQIDNRCLYFFKQNLCQRKYIVHFGFYTFKVHAFLCCKYITQNPTELPHRISESLSFARQSLAPLLGEAQVLTKTRTCYVKYGIHRINSRQK